MSEPQQNDSNVNEQQVSDNSVFNASQENVEGVENAAASETAQPAQEQNFAGQEGAPAYDWQANGYAQPAGDPNAYTPYPEHQNYIPNSQYPYAAPAQGYYPVPGVQYPKSKVAAGILGILLGGLGIHKFYLGYTGPALILLLSTILTFGFASIVTSVIGLVEGIIYLTMSDERFHQTYVVGRKEWF